MGSERVISKTTGITACLYIDGDDPVERKLGRCRRGGTIAGANVLG